MSPAMVGISTTYKTRVALESLVRKNWTPLLDSLWTANKRTHPNDSSALDKPLEPSAYRNPTKTDFTSS
jgi:hypothetical protein